MAAVPLTADQMAALPENLPQWCVVEGKLHRELRFADFVEAFGFMSRVALVAEAQGSLIVKPSSVSGLVLASPAVPAIPGCHAPEQPGPR